MLKTFTIYWCIILYIIQSNQCNAQGELFSLIEANNKDLIAFQKSIEAKDLTLKSSNRLQGLEIGFDYLPGSPANAGTQKDVQIVQPFEWPTVYKERKHLNQTTIEILNAKYRSLRKEILLQAFNLSIEYRFLKKKKNWNLERLTLTKKIIDRNQELFQAEELSLIDHNKSKLLLLEIEFAQKEINTQLTSVLDQLASLNGGIQIPEEALSDNQNTHIPTLDSLWKEIQEKSPHFHEYEAQLTAATQNIHYQKINHLPKGMIGYHYQTVLGQTYQGVHVGITVPLWQAKPNIEAAKQSLSATQAQKIAHNNQAFSKLNALYKQYQTLSAKYKAYKETIEGMENETLLTDYYESGEITFTHYYLEISFFRQTIDKLIHMEKELYLLKAQLISHQF